MPVLVPAAAQIRQELSVAIVEGENARQDLIGKRILPDYPITRRNAHLIKATLADTLGLRTISAAKYLRAPGTKFERAVAKFGGETVTVALRGMEIPVPNETQLDLAGFLDTESFFANRLGMMSALTQEELIANAIFAPATFGAATNSTVAYTAANLATMNPIGDIVASIRRVKAKGEIPNTVVMSGPVFERIRFATSMLAYIAGTLRPGMDVTANTLAMALAEYGIKQVLIGDQYVNTAADGATPVLSQIWSNAYIWVGRTGDTFGTDQKGDNADGVGVATLAGVGANLYWEGYTPGGQISMDQDALIFEGGNYVESYPDLTIDSVILRVKLSAQPYVGNARAGDLIATQYA